MPEVTSMPTPTGISFADLYAKDLPLPSWVVEGILPEGLCILGGAPKSRKSFLVQHLSLSVASDQLVFGHFKPHPGRVLHLALEDNQRRFSARMRAMYEGKPLDNAYLENDWPALKEGGLEKITEELDKFPSMRLVVIDTLARVRRSRRSTNVYQDDYEELAPLQEMANSREGLAIVIVHHTRKAAADDVIDELSGSHGLSGCVDTIWMLQTKQNNSKGTLHVTGRDACATVNLEFSPERFIWVSVEKVPHDYGRGTIGETRRHVLDVLNSSPDILTPIEISAKLNIPKATVKMTLTRMVQFGEAERAGRGAYRSTQQKPTLLS